MKRIDLMKISQDNIIIRNEITVFLCAGHDHLFYTSSQVINDVILPYIGRQLHRRITGICIIAIVVVLLHGPCINVQTLYIVSVERISKLNYGDTTIIILSHTIMHIACLCCCFFHLERKTNLKECCASSSADAERHC